MATDAYQELLDLLTTLRGRYGMPDEQIAKREPQED